MQSIAETPVHDAVDARFPAPTPDHISTNGRQAHAKPATSRAPYALTMVDSNYHMLLWELARVIRLTQTLPAVDEPTRSVLDQLSGRLQTVRDTLATVITPAMQVIIDAEEARFEDDMAKYNAQMRRQRPAAGKVRHG